MVIGVGLGGWLSDIKKMQLNRYGLQSDHGVVYARMKLKMGEFQICKDRAYLWREKGWNLDKACILFIDFMLLMIWNIKTKIKSYCPYYT